MTSSTLLMRRSAAGLFAAALLLSACGSSGGSDSEKKSTTTTAAEKTTTTTKAETTTTEADSADGPTADELATILPKAEEMGGTYKLDETSDDVDTAIETATKDQCPDAAAVLAPAEDDEPTIAFIDDAQTSVRVTLSAGVETLDPADIQAAADSINSCDDVTADENGLTITASFDASPNTDYGDGGLQIAVSVNITDGTDSYDLKQYRVLFTVGTVGVTVTGSDGFTDDGTVTPVDNAGLDALATEMATRAGNL